MPPSSTPLEAFVLPDPPSPRGAWWRWLLACGALLLVVGLVSAAIYGLGTLATGVRSGPDASGSLVDHWETPAERLVNITQAMTAQEVGSSAGELRDLQRLLTRLTNASNAGDDAAYRACIDVSLLARRIGRHPIARGDPAHYSWTLKAELQTSLETPIGLGEFSIVRVERGRSPDQVLVYTVEADHQQTAAFRWWLARSGRNWRVVDYERLDHGQSLAAAWAVRGAIDRDPSATNYYRLQEAVAQVESPYDYYLPGVNRGGKPLASFLNQALPPVVHDVGRLDLAWALLGNNQPAAALKACQDVRQPDEHPGVYLVRGRALALLSRHAQAIDEARKYQALAGRDPQALTIEAEALETLDELSLAASKWRELLDLCPQHAQALRNFCRLASDEQRAQLPQIFARLRKPIDAAVEQAQAALYREDAQTFEALQDFIRGQSPQSPALDVLTAARLSHEDQHEQAAALYLKASQAEWLPEKKQQYFNQFLWAMTEAGKAAEAYAQADDADAAFDYLTGGFEDEEAVITAEQLGPLLALHRKRRPQEPMIDFYEGLLLLQKQQFAEAEACFAAAADKGGEDYEREMFRGRRVEALFRQGKWDAAYELQGRSSEVFRQLGYLCQQHGQWDDLRQLIVRHRAQYYDDGWIDYFQALDYQHRGQYQAALDAIRRAQTDEELRGQCEWLKADLALKAGDLAAAYADGPDRRATFADLALRLAGDEDWQRINELARLHAADLPTDPEARNWNTRALFAQGKYEEATRQLTPWPAFTSDAATGTLESLHEWLVRSHLRMGRKAEARAAAERASQELQHDLPLVMVLLAEGDFAALRERLADRALVQSLLERQLDNDPELRQLLHTAELAEFRRGLVLPPPNRLAGKVGHLTLLLAEPVVLSADELRVRLTAAGLSAAEVRSVPRGESDLQSSYWVPTEHGVLLVTFGQAPYSQSADLDQPPPDAALADVLKKHAGYVVIDFQRLELEPGSEQIVAVASRLTAALCGDQAQAVSGWQGSGEYLLAATDGPTRERLAQGKFFQFMRPLPVGTHSYPLYATAAPLSGDPTEAEWSARRKQFLQLARDLIGGTQVQREVQIDLLRGHARERIWLQAVAARPARFGGYELHGELPTDSVLWPHLRAATRVEVGQYEVLAIR